MSKDTTGTRAWMFTTSHKWHRCEIIEVIIVLISLQLRLAQAR